MTIVTRIVGRPLTDKEKLAAGMAFTFCFMIVEACFAIVAGSLAMLGDAAHMLTDAASFAVSLAALRVAERGPTAAHTYGLARVEVLGALASTLGLWLVTGVLVSESVRRIRAFSSGDAPPVDGKLMVLLGVFGLLTNLALERVLGAHSHGIGGHDCGHGHDHGHAHGGGHDGHDGHDCCEEHNPMHDEGHSHAAHAAHEHESHGHASHDHAKAEVSDHSHSSPDHDESCCDGDHAHEKDVGGDIELGDHAHSAHGHAATAGGHAHSASKDGGHSHAAHASTDGGHGHSAHAHARAPSAKTPLAAAGGTSYSAVPRDEHAAPPAPKRQINIDAAYLHVLGDLLQNLGVVVAGIIIWARPDWQVVDPLVTLVFSGIVLYTTVGLIKRTGHILLEGVPDSIDVLALQDALRGLDGVADVHDVHVWELTADKPAMSCHVILAPGAGHDGVLAAAQETAAKHGVDHATIQVQGPGVCLANTCCSTSTSLR